MLKFTQLNQLSANHLLAGVLSIVTFISFLRFVLVFNLPLSADEAHYGLYALHLDWSYFDHPPMIGWLQFVAVGLFGEQDWALRVVPSVVHIGTAWLVFVLTMRLYPDQYQQRQHRAKVMGLVAVLLFESTLMFQLMGIVMLPDVPLLFFTLLSLLCFDWACRTNQWRAWIMYGFCLGLMGLSKYTAIVMALSYFLWIVFSYPSLFFNPRLWVAALIGLSMIVPVIYWNIEHAWLSFSYQFEHSSIATKQWSWGDFFRAQAVNLLSYGVLLFIATWTVVSLTVKKALRDGYQRLKKGMRITVRLAKAQKIAKVHRIKANTEQRKTPRKMNRVDDLSALLRCTIVLYFSIFAYSSAQGGHYLPHWVAMLFVLSIPYLAFGIVRLYEKLKSSSNIILSASLWVVTLLIVATPFVLVAVLLSGKLDEHLTYQAWRGVIGWKESAQIAKRLIHHDPKLAKDPTIYVANWSEASRVAWYAHPIAVLPIDDKIGQFDLWFAHQTKAEVRQNNRLYRPQQKGILLSPVGHDELEEAKGRFSQCTLLRRLVFYQHKVLFPFVLYRCVP